MKEVNIDFFQFYYLLFDFHAHLPHLHGSCRPSGLVLTISGIKMYSTTTNNTKLLWLEAITYQNSETMALKSISIMQRNSDQLISSTPVIPWIAEILVPEMVNTKPEGLQDPCRFDKCARMTGFPCRIVNKPCCMFCKCTGNCKNPIKK